jgi:hypothetical protein
MPTRAAAYMMIVLAWGFVGTFSGCQPAESVSSSHDSTANSSEIEMGSPSTGRGGSLAAESFPPLVIGEVANGDNKSGLGQTLTADGPLLLPVPGGGNNLRTPATSGQPQSSPAAEKAFAKLLEAARGTSNGEQWQVAEAELQQLGTAALGTYLAHLHDEDQMVRELASMFLAQLGPEAESAAPILAGSLKDSSLFVRANVASVLSTIPDQEAVVTPVLVELLESNDANTRMIAATSLGNIASNRQLFAQAEPSLLKLLRDDEPQVRQAAIRSLGQAVAPGAQVRQSLRLVAQKSDDPLQEEAAAALRRLDGAPQAGDATPAGNVE